MMFTQVIGSNIQTDHNSFGEGCLRITPLSAFITAKFLFYY